MADDADLAFADGADEDNLNDEDASLEGADAEIEDSKKDDPFYSLLKHHPECVLDYAETIASKLPLTSAPSFDKDPNHRSPPFLTQYEKTKILGMRANQLSQGARPYIKVPEYVTGVSEIARMELEQRRLPFIVKRPMPNGSYEYWRLSDLLIL
jgi:DNA-directed RNA polymerase I, II, and III subunit RPABC2